MLEEIRDTTQPKILLPYLIDAAQKENWGLVDENLLTVCNNPDFVDWALQKGLGDPNGDLRDLAVSILEKSQHEIEPKEVIKLKELMKADANHYVRFRASFALFNHGVRTPSVIKTLKSAIKNRDVGEVAKGYLSQLHVKKST